MRLQVDILVMHGSCAVTGLLARMFLKAPTRRKEHCSPGSISLALRTLQPSSPMRFKRRLQDIKHPLLLSERAKLLAPSLCICESDKMGKGQVNLMPGLGTRA